MPYVGYPVSLFPSHLVEHVDFAVKLPDTWSNRSPERISLGIPQIQVADSCPIHKISTAGYRGMPVIELRRFAVVLRSRVKGHQRIVHEVLISVVDDRGILGERIILDLGSVSILHWKLLQNHFHRFRSTCRKANRQKQKRF